MKKALLLLITLFLSGCNKESNLRTDKECCEFVDAYFLANDIYENVLMLDTGYKFLTSSSSVFKSEEDTCWIYTIALFDEVGIYECNYISIVERDKTKAFNLLPEKLKKEDI